MNTLIEYVRKWQPNAKIHEIDSYASRTLICKRYPGCVVVYQLEYTDNETGEYLGTGFDVVNPWYMVVPTIKDITDCANRKAPSDFSNLVHYPQGTTNEDFNWIDFKYYLRTVGDGRTRFDRIFGMQFDNEQLRTAITTAVNTVAITRK